MPCPAYLLRGARGGIGPGVGAQAAHRGRVHVVDILRLGAVRQTVPAGLSAERQRGVRSDDGLYDRLSPAGLSAETERGEVR